MQASEYQRAARTTAIYPAAAGVYYPALGLSGEVGEIANKLKKVIRGDVTFEQRRDELRDELGDVLWYAAAMASDLGLDLGDLAYSASQQNPIKADIYGLALELNWWAGRIANQAIEWRIHGVDDNRRGTFANHLLHVLSVCAHLAVILETDLETVCHDNIKKLFARKEAGTIKGDGDKR